jgi:hypothetical protein
VIYILYVVVFVGLSYAGMWWGWNNRKNRQAAVYGELPVAPTEFAATKEEDALYVSTTSDLTWQDRVVAFGLGFRGPAGIALSKDGVLITRTGRPGVWIAANTLIDARADKIIAGKFMGKDDLLVLRWTWNDNTVHTGLKLDDIAHNDEWIAAINDLATQKGTVQ